MSSSLPLSEPGLRPTKSVKDYIKNNMRDYGMLLSLFAIMLFFQIVTDGTLLKPLNLTNLVLQNSYIVIMALGMLLVIVAGHIDLSVGSVAGFIGGLAAVMIVQWGIPYVPAVILCLVAGGLIGAAQGSFVAYFKIPSFIVTLAGMLVFKGLTLALLHGQSVGPFPVAFQRLSSGFIPDLFDGSTLRITSLAIGILAALAGLIFAARLNTATPKAGLGFELDVIAACFIGGASAYGGVGTVMGAVIGAFIMGVMNNGMSILGIGIDYQQVIKGLVLLAAVFVDVYNKRK
jgi:putative multiple sugar transport system permease protein